MSGEPLQRLHELLEAYLDDELDEHEARELRGLVKRDAALRAEFLGQVRWHLRLADRLRQPGIPLSERVEALLDADGRTPRIADAVAERISARSSRRNQISTRFVRRRRREAAPWWVAAAAGVLLAAGLLLVLPERAAPVAVVRGDRGTLERAGQVLHLGAQPQALAAGDALVADGADLALSFPDGTAVELSAGARLVVRSGVRSGGPKLLELERGGLVARVARQRAGEALLVSTPQARATVLGTVFRVRIESVGTRLVVEEGRIAFARAGGGTAVEVPGGRSAMAGNDGSLALIEAVAPAPAAKPAAWTPQPFSASAGRPFGDDSPYNRAIPAKAVLDAQSSVMAARLAAQPAALALFRHALPVYDVDATTPLRAVVTVKRPERGALPAQGLRVPDGALPNSGSNRSLLLLDWSEGRAWELYRFAWDGDGIRIDSGGSVPFDGDGVPRIPSGYAGGSYLAGLVRVREIAQGRIPHALAFGTSQARKGVWRHPAQQTDGRLTGVDTIPVGARIQLDPTLDLDAIPGLTPGERTIAVALQTYGAYCVGASGEPFLFFCELAPDATDAGNPGAVYSANGLTRDGATLTHLPLGALRVLKQWDGGAE